MTLEERARHSDCLKVGNEVYDVVAFRLPERGDLYIWGDRVTKCYVNHDESDPVRPIVRLRYTLVERPSEAPSESVLQEADRLVSGDRGADYGHPLDDFSKVTGMALALWGRGPESPEEHAIYMVLVKIAREANKHKRDNLVDIAGYVKTLDMVIEERERRGL